MKYTQIFLESLQCTSLKRVRIKIDPAAISVSEDLSKCNGYEGYVLAEDSSVVKVLVIRPDTGKEANVINVPPGYLETIIQDDMQNKLTELKGFIITALNPAVDDPIIQQIQSSESTDDIESFLRDRGLSSEDITKLYKYYSML
jgi:hypothetical protein